MGVDRAVAKVIAYLEKNSIKVTGDMIDSVATISTNNDPELGKIIGDAFRAVGETGVVMMEPTASSETKVEVVEGVQYEKGLTNSNFVTNRDSKTAELENPLVMLVDSPVESVRQIQTPVSYTHLTLPTKRIV